QHSVGHQLTAASMRSSRVEESIWNATCTASVNAACADLLQRLALGLQIEDSKENQKGELPFTPTSRLPGASTSSLPFRNELRRAACWKPRGGGWLMGATWADSEHPGPAPRGVHPPPRAAA